MQIIIICFVPTSTHDRFEMSDNVINSKQQKANNEKDLSLFHVVSGEISLCPGGLYLGGVL